MALQAKVSHAAVAAFEMGRTSDRFLKREKINIQGPVYVTPSLGRELTELGLYSDILKRIQDVNEYGGGASIFQIRQAVLDAVDAGAYEVDQTLVGLRGDLRERANAWSDVEDHEARSSFFDTYCEATFYLSSSNRIEIEARKRLLQLLRHQHHRPPNRLRPQRKRQPKLEHLLTVLTSLQSFANWLANTEWT